MTRTKKNFINQKKLTSVLIKPAGPDCNLHCHYCFYLKKSNLFPETRVHRMSLEILEETIKQAMSQSAPEIYFGWQGGEPTLIGLDFFRQAVYFQQKYGEKHSVSNGFQTNGLLINKDWAKFFREYNFLVGLSLDGPQHIHDRYRQHSNGHGSWEKAVEAAKLLLDSEVATNALVVVNDYSARFPEEIYQFLKSLGLTYMQFIPCLEPDPKNPHHPASFSVSIEQYGDFLLRLFELWKADFHNGQPSIYVRNFESLLFAFAGLTPPDCNLHKECGDYLVIEHNGEVYSCDFYVQPEWNVGNIKDKRLIDMLNSATQRKFGKRKSLLPEECKKCEWLVFCRGGCPKERGFAPEPEKSYFCQSYKRFFQKTSPFFQELIKNLKNK
ncbi:MAG TPA: anaerobic sulfatase maturase [Candidatus Aminicenantes bacterium]|nr:MAG: anaerobic sulfatase maturase [Candidatus Aminicenantes bacterium]HEK86165.1 anaerobic sulfatase maturase [Candidatus Aminicenantes bacterium]